MSDVGKRILEDLTQDLDEDLFWEWFEPEEFYTRSEGAFRDEGDDWECDLCNEVTIGSAECVEEDRAEDIMKEHIFEEHSDAIIREALKDYFTQNKPQGTQKTMQEFGGVF
jgi:hypothetical protein